MKIKIEYEVELPGDNYTDINIEILQTLENNSK